MEQNRTDLHLRETRAWLEQALRESLEADHPAESLTAAVRDFAAASLALNPDLTRDAVVHRVLRLVLHVARTTSTQGDEAARPPFDRVIALGRSCVGALHAVGELQHAPGARAARERARAVVAAALRARMRSSALVAASNAEMQAAERIRDELRRSVSQYVRALRQLGEPAELVITDVRVLALESASEICAADEDPRSRQVAALNDEIVRLAIDSYYDAPAA